MKHDKLRRSKLNIAILAALSTSTAVYAAESENDENAAKERDTGATLIITATKRSESIQDVPVAVQALSGESLEKMGVDNFQEYVEYLPNVVFQGVGPGTNEVYIRGAATSQTQLSVSSVQALQPSVAIYLDEQPVSMQGRNLDIYAADMERIEVLPGPQGTLFGASSQAGTVRLISKKPEHDAGYSAGFDMGMSTTSGGEMSYSTQAYLNFSPIDELAFRVTIYNDQQGGWIDNVLNDPSNGGYGGSTVHINRISGGILDTVLTMPVEDIPIDAPTNDSLVEKDHNDATYGGIRFGASFEFSEDWSLLLQHTQQTLATEGVFAYDPTLAGEQSTVRFIPEENNDEFGLTTWTLKGRLGQLDLVYTGGYLNRDINSRIDYTGYTNGGLFSAYYNCNYYVADEADAYCADPAKFYDEVTDSNRTTHEFRFNTDLENAWRITSGVYLDEQIVASVGRFNLGNLDLNYFSNLERTLVGTDGINSDGGPFPPSISFINDITHTISQQAVFGQFEFDFTDTVTASIGARYYDIEDEFRGSTSTVDVSARLDALGQGGQALIDYFGADEAAAIEAAIAAGNLDTSLLDNDGNLNVDDIIYKATVDWHASDDIMIFGTWSEGFRPPVTNRVGAGAASNSTGAFATFRIPAYSLSDTLTNYEFGFKSNLFDRKLRFNATAYYSEITELQTGRYDPANISFLVFTDNVGDAEIKGIDGDFTWLASDNFVISGAFSFLKTELTRINAELENIAPPVGSRLPYSSEFSANLQAEYYFPVTSKLEGYVRGGIAYTGDRLASMEMSAYAVEDATQLVFGTGSGLTIERESDVYDGVTYTDTNGNTFAGGRYVQESYILANLTVGVTSGEWKAEMFIDNLTDEHAQLYIDVQSFTPKVITNRPRTIGVRFSHDF